MRSVREHTREVVVIDEDRNTDKYGNIQIMPMYAQYYNADDITLFQTTLLTATSDFNTLLYITK
jgi:hypothetical protein